MPKKKEIQTEKTPKDELDEVVVQIKELSIKLDKIVQLLDCIEWNTQDRSGVFPSKKAV